MTYAHIPSNIPQIKDLLNGISKVDPAMYYSYSYSGPADKAGQFFDSEKDENNIIINVEDDIDAEDISLTLSAHDTTLTVEISKENANGDSFHLKKKYSRNNKFDPQKITAYLSEGKLVIYAPAVEKSTEKKTVPITRKK